MVRPNVFVCARGPLQLGAAHEENVAEPTGRKDVIAFEGVEDLLRGEGTLPRKTALFEEVVHAHDALAIWALQELVHELVVAIAQSLCVIREQNARESNLDELSGVLLHVAGHVGLRELWHQILLRDLLVVLSVLCHVELPVRRLREILQDEHRGRKRND